MKREQTTNDGRCKTWHSEILLIVLLVILISGNEATAGTIRKEPRPALAGDQRTELIAAIGTTTELRCLVTNQGSHIVSWVRVRDARVLAHAGEVFTADGRVSAGSDNDSHWLRLAGVRTSDAGRYECQLNTDPKTSLRFTLNVVLYITSTSPPLTPLPAPAPERMAGDQPARDLATTARAAEAGPLILLLVIGVLL